MDRIVTVFKRDEWAFEKLKNKWYFIAPICERFRITDKQVITKLESVKRDNIYDDNEIVKETLKLILSEKKQQKSNRHSKIIEATFEEMWKMPDLEDEI